MPGSLNRRQLLAASAALTAPFGLSRSAAQPASLASVPVVDRLVMTVITDSSYDTPRATGSSWVKVRRAGLASPTDYRKTLHNEWGLALALESRAGAQPQRYLLDFGYTVDAFL